MSAVETWTKPPLEAASFSVSICEHCGSVIVRLEAKSDEVFAEAHINAEQTITLIAWLEEAKRRQ